jgi:hypothetical protein
MFPCQNFTALLVLKKSVDAIISLALMSIQYLGVQLAPALNALFLKR